MIFNRFIKFIFDTLYFGRRKPLFLTEQFSYVTGFGAFEITNCSEEKQL